MTDDWHSRVAALWDDETVSDDERIALMDRLAAERPAGEARALFERAGARDAAGREAEAEPLYRAALEAGLDDDHRPQAVIQLASTLRNLDRPDEAMRMLRAELDRDPVSPLRDEAAAFLALCLVSAGDAREAASVALTTLAPHLTRYRRSVASYAAELRADGA
ncbi:tetratricopeptide repeat protein [Microbacterium cremeum]|uniref:tetratricopeptide repeat protein n=1 Tax=Microbacterium cremeum TaxID=2782169 RepID=UPI001E2AED48|nr:tetratricopeptide repeat protein [Microbacterium cremeum]